MNTCSICGKSFKNLPGLKGHVATVHEGKGRKGRGPSVPKGMALIPLAEAQKKSKALFKKAGASEMEFIDSKDACAHLLNCSYCKADLLAKLREQGYTISEPVQGTRLPWLR